ncbi:MAG: hypothetical protein JOZ71_06360 [Ktedonobacteraceae bacterium]|nr:hypothetical protein [Ktedonobacteraceae bacterium]
MFRPSTSAPFRESSIGPTLTVGGELNKLACNISQARDLAGVHWRTDATEANLLGEKVAISILNDMQELYREPFKGYSLTKFDGTRVTVGGDLD